MKYKVLAVRDRAMDAYLRPMYMQSLGQGIRAFGDEINRKSEENPMHHHPDDYDLYHIGEWDEDSGQFTNLPQPKQIAIGKSLSTKGD